jgi:hypothetical protein
MFGLKNKAFQIQMVDPKTDEPNGPTTNVYNIDPAEAAKVATDVVVKTVGAIGAVIAGHKVLTTICDIAVIAAKAKLK